MQVDLERVVVTIGSFSASGWSGSLGMGSPGYIAGIVEKTGKEQRPGG